MSSEGFSLASRPIAVEMELRFGTHSERVKGLLVGQRRPEYLIVEISKKHNWTEVQDWFNDAATVIIRGVLDQGEVVAGAAGFLNAITRPQRMVYLTYPQRFETRTLRLTPRIEVELDAVIRAAPKLPSPFGEGSSLTELKGTIVDISRSGMGFETEAREELNIEKLNGTVIEVEVFDEGQSLLKVLAEIRGAKAHENLILMGLLVDREEKQFVSSLDTLVLHSKLIKQAIKG